MRRSWFVAAIALGVAAIVIAVIAMRATDDSPETTTDWADAVCTSLADWRSAIAALADGGPVGGDALRDRLDEAESATTQLVTELHELGPPDVVDGEEVEEALDDATAGLEESLEELRVAAEDAIEARSGPALAGVVDDFQALLQQARELVATLQSASLFGEASAELEQAFAAAASCGALQSDS